MPKALRSRCLEAFLKRNGVKEPEDVHISLVEALVFSDKPSARASLPGGVCVARNYDRLEVLTDQDTPTQAVLPCPGETEFSGFRISCAAAEEIINTPDVFTVHPAGTIWVGPRQSGDALRLPGGTKSLKKLFIDRKIPAAQRPGIPVIRDESGILGAYFIGVHQDRAAQELPAVTIRFEKIENKGE